jgi:hypothetical protein
MAKSDPKKSKSQVAKFRATARALAADQDEAAFDATLKQSARHKPTSEDGSPGSPAKRSEKKDR